MGPTINLPRLSHTSPLAHCLCLKTLLKCSDAERCRIHRGFQHEGISSGSTGNRSLSFTACPLLRTARSKRSWLRTTSNDFCFPLVLKVFAGFIGNDPQLTCSEQPKSFSSNQCKTNWGTKAPEGENQCVLISSLLR